MYQNQYNSSQTAGYNIVTTTTGNFTPQQQYYNYYYPQQQPQGDYYPYPPPTGSLEGQNLASQPPAEGNSNEPPPPGTGTTGDKATQIEPVTQGENSAKSQQEEDESQVQIVKEPSLNSTVPSEKSGVYTSVASNNTQYNSSYVYPQPTSHSQVNTTETSWSGVHQPTTTTTSTSATQWYTPQGSVAGWSGNHQQSSWPNYPGNWQQSNWPLLQPQQQQQQQQLQQQTQQQLQGSNQGTQQHQWDGGWNNYQWGGQGGGASTGQWGQWQGQPGVEAWTGQTYGVYQQQGYSYPSYGSAQQQPQQPPQQQQLQATNFSSPPSKPLAKHPKPPRPSSPGTPPLPDLPPPGNQTEAPVHQGPNQGQGVNDQYGRKHQRTSDVGNNASGKRIKKGGNRSRWSDPKESEAPPNYKAVPPPNLPLPTPNLPPSHNNYSHHQRHHPPSGPPHHNSSYPYPPPVSHQPPIMSAPSGIQHSSKSEHQDKVQHQEPQNDSSAPNNQNKEKMPLKMKEYVARAFTSASTEEERELVHHHLDSKLNKIFAENKQWSIDWDAYPMPLDEIRKKSSSRWDTPSPSADFMNLTIRRSPQFSPSSQMSGEQRGNEYKDEEEGWSFGRGRGKKRKRGRKRGKNNKFFIDHQPIPGMNIGGNVTQEDKAKINQRIDRFGKQGATTEGNKNTRKKISIDDMVKSVTSSNVDEQIYWQDSSVEGTSQSLEKRYLRLTSAPDPSMVRPLHVLKRSLSHVCEKWKANRDDYHYACEQFKSIRQDLTIQGIRNAFTVEVYETHGRVALENNDREEFNQCQTQLMALYEEEPAGTYPNQPEYIAYRILYLILTKNTEAMSTILLELTPLLRKTPCIEHTQTLCSAWLSGNYSKFFKSYRTAPFLCGALINIFVERERKVALKTMTKAYRPSLPVLYVSDVLGFPDRDHCLAFLVAMDAVLISDGTTIDCKLTQAKLSTPTA